MSLGLAWATQQVLDLSCIERPSLTKQRRGRRRRKAWQEVWSWKKALVWWPREARGTTYRQIPCHPVLGERAVPKDLQRAGALYLGNSPQESCSGAPSFFSVGHHPLALSLLYRSPIAKKTPAAQALRQLEALCSAAWDPQLLLFLGRDRDELSGDAGTRYASKTPLFLLILSFHTTALSWASHPIPSRTRTRGLWGKGHLPATNRPCCPSPSFAFTLPHFTLS